MKIGKRILELRKKQNITQEQLAEKFDITRQTISHLPKLRNWRGMFSERQDIQKSLKKSWRNIWELNSVR